jgi:hypothetical protein
MSDATPPPASCEGLACERTIAAIKTTNSREKYSEHKISLSPLNCTAAADSLASRDQSFHTLRFSLPLPRLVLGWPPVSDEQDVAVQIAQADLSAVHVLGMADRAGVHARLEQLLAELRQISRVQVNRVSLRARGSPLLPGRT